MLKKLINDPFDAVDEMLEGFVAAHADVVRLAAPRVVARRAPGGPKVGLVIGGGSGHEPAFAGYVGPGLADAAALGNVFAAPAPDVCLEAIRAASSGRGVLLAYGNYAGDVLNFDLAAELAAGEGIETRTVRVTDDVASAPPAERDAAARDRRRRVRVQDRRRGRRARRRPGRGRAARRPGERRERAASGSPCRRARSPAPAGRRSRSGPTRSRSGWASTASPASSAGGSSRPTPSPSGWSTRSSPTGRRAASAGGEVALLVNGLGATAYLDLYILYRAARRCLEAAGCDGQPELRRRVRHVARDGRGVDLRPPPRRRAPAAPRRTGPDGPARLMGDALRAAILAACDAVEGAREALCELDASTGDGDHGVTMTIGARGVRRQLDGGRDRRPGRRSSAPRRSGWPAPAARSARSTAGACWRWRGRWPPSRPSGSAGNARDPRPLRRGGRGGGRRPWATPGPATRRSSTRSDRPRRRSPTPTVPACRSTPRSCAARAAARAGAEATTGMVATVGRSARFGERSRGTPDPGATSFAIIVDALVGSVLEPAEPLAGASGATRRRARRRRRLRPDRGRMTNPLDRHELEDEPDRERGRRPGSGRSLPLVADLADRDLFVLPPFTAIWVARERLRDSADRLGRPGRPPRRRRRAHRRRVGPDAGRPRLPLRRGRPLGAAPRPRRDARAHRGPSCGRSCAGG